MLLIAIHRHPNIEEPLPFTKTSVDTTEVVGTGSGITLMCLVSIDSRIKSEKECYPSAVKSIAQIML